MKSINLENVTINTQSSVRIAGAKTIYFDPLEISGELHDADIIFISHDHYDHFSTKDIAKVVKDNTVIVFPKTMKSHIDETGISEDRQRGVAPTDKLEVSGITTEVVPAYNKMKPFHPKKNGWVGYIIEIDGICYYFAGDTDAVDEAKAVQCDVAFLPIGGTYTTDAKEAAKLANVIRPSVVVPMHYGSIVGKPKDAETFKAGVDKEICVVEKLKFWGR